VYDAYKLNHHKAYIAEKLSYFYNEYYPKYDLGWKGMGIENRILNYKKLGIALIEEEGCKGFLDESIKFKF